MSWKHVVFVEHCPPHLSVVQHVCVVLQYHAFAPAKYPVQPRQSPL